jgi:hypothetical protein
MPEIPELRQSEVKRKKYPCTQQEKDEPLMTTQVIIQKEEKLIDFLHAEAIYTV